jgi:hypothetical protein
MVMHMDAQKPSIRLCPTFLLLAAWSALVGAFLAAVPPALCAAEWHLWSDAVGAGIGFALIAVGVVVFNALTSRGKLRWFVRHDRQPTI